MKIIVLNKQPNDKEADYGYYWRDDEAEALSYSIDIITDVLNEISSFDEIETTMKFVLWGFEELTPVNATIMYEESGEKKDL